MKKPIIYKYELKPEPGKERISMPRGAVLLSVREQGVVPVLYALVDLNNVNVEYEVVKIATGFSIHDMLNGKYLGTAMCERGSNVLHVFY